MVDPVASKDVQEELGSVFDAATQFVAASSSSGLFSSSQLLRFYGLYKAATAGACTAKAPWIFQRQARAKWNAWHSCSKLSSSQAQQQYVELLSELKPGWAGAAGSSKRRGGAGGPVQSRMAEAPEAEDSEAPDSAPALLQAAREGDAALAQQLLQQQADINQRGSEGETALHWAADKGHLDVLRLLLASGADVNARDSDGLTPLHYAALAEQEAAARELAAAPGVDLGLRSSEGEAAADVTPAGWSFLRGGT